MGGVHLVGIDAHVALTDGWRVVSIAIMARAVIEDSPQHMVTLLIKKMAPAASAHQSSASYFVLSRYRTQKRSAIDDSAATRSTMLVMRRLLWSAT